MPKIAAVQMCSSNSVDENLQQLEKWVAEAARLGAALVVLPENVAIMETSPEQKRKAFERDGEGKIQSFLSDLARRYKVWLVGGTIPIVSENPAKAYAACLVFNDRGERVACYNKIHLFDVALSANERYAESDLTKAGDQVVVVDTPLGKMGVAVCYDLRFPEQFRAMFHRGVDFIVLPTAFTVPTGKAHWEVLTRARAIENLCYFIGSCQGGSHANGRKTYGHSLIIEPWGGIVRQLGESEAGAIVCEIEQEKIRDARKTIPVEQHHVPLDR